MEEQVRSVKVRMDALNRELLRMEKDSILLNNDDIEARTQLEDNLRQWILRKERFTAEDLRPVILRQLPLCHDALDILSTLQSTGLHERVHDLHARFQDLRIDQRTTRGGRQRTEKEEEEELEESEVKKKVLEKMVVTAKSLVSEIKDEVEGRTERETVSFWLNKHASSPYFPYEWNRLNHLRSKVRQTAIELSYLLAQFVVFLIRNDEEDSRFQRLFGKIKSLSLGHEDRKVAAKLSSVISATKESVAQMRLKEMMRAGSSSDMEEVLEKMVNEFFEIALHLDAIMSTLSIPADAEDRSMVPGARVRLEGMLGHALCAMQGLKLRVGKIRRKRKSESWKALKVKIGELWKDLECFREEEDAVVPDVDNDVADDDGVVPVLRRR